MVVRWVGKARCRGLVSLHTPACPAHATACLLLLTVSCVMLMLLLPPPIPTLHPPRARTLSRPQDGDSEVQFWKLLLCDPKGSWTPSLLEQEERRQGVADNPNWPKLRNLVVRCVRVREVCVWLAHGALCCGVLPLGVSPVR